MIWCGETSNVRSVGHAKGAVPMKMMRIESLQAQPLVPLPLGALKLADHEITRRWAHTIEKQHTLEVVHLVLEGACEQPFSLHFNCSPLTILTAYDHMRGSWCRAVHHRQAEAPFVLLDPPLSFDNLRVDEGHQRVGIAATRHIDHEQAEREPCLRSSQANTRCVVHGLNHIVDQALEGIVNGHNRLSLATQHRIGKCVDWQHRHALCPSTPWRDCVGAGSAATFLGATVSAQGAQRPSLPPVFSHNTA